MIKLPDLLPPPSVCPEKLKDAHWLSGEGAGSWFIISKYEPFYTVYLAARYSPEGNFECGGFYQTMENFNPLQDYQLTYPSHCLKITIAQEGNVIPLELTKKLSPLEFAVEMQGLNKYKLIT